MQDINLYKGQCDIFELEKIIRMKGYTKKEIADAMGLSENGLILKMKNKTEFKASEIAFLVNLLDLPNNSIFFSKKVNTIAKSTSNEYGKNSL